MPKSFIELEKQYQKLSHELRHTLEKLAWYCSDFEIKDEGDVYNPFELGYEEKYSSHWIDVEQEILHLHTDYVDSYDTICDSSSDNKYPLHWVEHAYNDTLEEIDAEIKSEILKFHYHGINQAKRDAVFQAIKFGLITEEQAKIELEKLL